MIKMPTRGPWHISILFSLAVIAITFNSILSVPQVKLDPQPVPTFKADFSEVPNTLSNEVLHFDSKDSEPHKSLHYGSLQNSATVGSRDNRYPSRHRCNITDAGNGMLNADCSHKGFSNISELNLPSPEKIRLLDLTSNKISSLPDKELSKFCNLRYLSLTDNTIEKLENNSFWGLTKLEALNLNKNYLLMTEDKFPKSVFSTLKKLNILSINDNQNNVEKTDLTLSYPDWALSALTSLETLYIDGLTSKTFGAGFQNMTSLKNLSMDGSNGSCNLGHLYNHTFQYLSQLVFLRMQHCRLFYDKIEAGVLKPLTRLEVLDVSRNINLDLDGLIPLLTGNNNTLQILIANTIVNPFSQSQCVSNELAAALPRSLTSIDGASNNLEIVSNRVFELLPPNLTYLNLNDNRFNFGGYLQNFSKMENLKLLQLNGWTKGFNLPQYFYQDFQPNSTKCTIGKVIETANHTFIFNLPPKLERLEMNVAYMTHDITKFTFNINNSFKELVLKGNNLPTLSGPVYGLLRLETLDLSDNNIGFISARFFDTFPSLTNLTLVQNDCGKAWHLSEGYVRLPKKLEYLDLSNMPLNDIHLDIEGIKNLKSLNLENCKMTSFTPNLTHATSLRYLNIASNNIYTIHEDVRDTLSNIPNLTIDITNNTIGCYCDNLPFLNWLYFYPHLKDRHDLEIVCGYQNSLVPISNFNFTVEMMRRECASNLVLLSICTAVSASIIFLISLLVAYRYRWRLTYWYYTLYLQVAGNHCVNSCAEAGLKFSQDALITYCTADEDLVELTINDALTALGCRICLKGRDFKPGNSEYLNIIESVQMCRRTLVVLSPQMLSDKWCKATVNLAGMEAQSSERSILIFLVLRPVTGKELGQYLLFHVQNSPVFFFPPEESWDNEEQMRIFWARLSRSLR